MESSPDDRLVSPEALRLGYQPEAAPARGLLIVIVAGATIMAGLWSLIWHLLQRFEASNTAADRPTSALILNDQPPPPNLQPSAGHGTMDYQDLEALHQREDGVFAKLGWMVDPQTHVVRIPQDIAERVAADARARAAGAFLPPSTTGGETNSINPGSTSVPSTQPDAAGGQRP